MVGGTIAAGFRLLHLEMSWHMVRSDLRKYYTRMRNDRALLETRPGPNETNRPITLDSEEAILAEAKRKGLLLR